MLSLSKFEHSAEGCKHCPLSTLACNNSLVKMHVTHTGSQQTDSEQPVLAFLRQEKLVVDAHVHENVVYCAMAVSTFEPKDVMFLDLDQFRLEYVRGRAVRDYITRTGPDKSFKVGELLLWPHGFLTDVTQAIVSAEVRGGLWYLQHVDAIDVHVP